MHVFSRLLFRFTGRRERAPGSTEAVPLAHPSDNPVVQAFLGGRFQEGRGLGQPRPAAAPAASAAPPGGEFQEDEARRIQERWAQQGAYAVSNTGKVRMTRRYFGWRQRVEALLSFPPKEVKDKAGEWRRWIAEHEARALWKLRMQGRMPRASGGIPPELARQVFEGEPLGEPPQPVYRFVLLYAVKLPDSSQYAFRDDLVQGEDRTLARENGVARAGSRICGHADLEELFTSAGISDVTERKVMKKVSEVHGGFESINTCDAGFVSAGFVPFTAGESGGGSLAQLLRRMKAASPAEFEACFRGLGIDVDARALRVVHPGSGQLLEGKEAVSAIIEDKRLTALFYNAGKKSRAYQVAQLQLARELYYLASQGFVLKALAQVGDRASLLSISGRYGDVLRSEAGKAAIMDRAIQQGPDNARQTFKEACRSVIEEKGLSTVESLALYEALITPVLQSPGKNRLRVLEDKDLSRPAELPLG
ncbi:MAG TPA: hypothetical protein VF815_11405 [Myxococcaceae bacterium]|jgi:hypothetical protein